MLSLRIVRRFYTTAIVNNAVSKHISKPLEEPALVKLKKERDPEKLFRLFKANAQNRLVIENRIAFEDTVSRLAGAQRFDYIEQLLEQQKKLPQGRREGFVVRIIMLYGKAGMNKHAVDTFYNMHLFGCSRTVKSYNAALMVLGQTRNVEDIKSFLLDVPQKFDISVDVYSLNIVTKVFCQLGLLDTAYLVMIEMEKAGIRPDVVTYTTLLSAFYKNDWCVIGNGLWNLMLHKGCSPNLATFNVRIQYLIRKRRVWQANRLMRMMRFVGIEPDEVTYNLVIKGFFLTGYSLMAKRIYSALHGNDCKPNLKVYQTMVHYLCEGGEFNEAFTMCKDSMAKNWFPSFDTICKLLEGLLNSSKSRNANIIMTLVRRRIPPFSKEEIKHLEHVMVKK